MIFATDVQYAGTGATAAGILFQAWEAACIDRAIVKEIGAVAPYEPGAFYKRELPCIMALMEEVDRPLEAIIVDGYVTLGQEERPGLGRHLYEALDGSVPVIGVAKKEFIGTPAECRLIRGTSRNPLFVTAAGLALAEAKSLLARMHGPHRIPAMLKKVDQLCRGLLDPGSDPGTSR